MDAAGRVTFEDLRQVFLLDQIIVADLPMEPSR